MKEIKIHKVNRRDKYIRKNFRDGYSNYIRRKNLVHFRNKRDKFYYNNRGNDLYKYRKNHGGKITNEKLDDDLDNYFRDKGDENYKNFLDNDIDMYIKNGTTKENIKEKLTLPPKDDKKVNTIKIERINKKSDNDKNKEKEKHNLKISVSFKG